MYPSQEVTDLRKSGAIGEAYKRAHELLKENPSDTYLKSALGWVLYDLVKSAVEEALKNDGQGQSGAGRVRVLLREYAHLELPRPDLLFSLLLAQILRIQGEISFLPGYLAWAGVDCFRAEDYKAQHRQDSEKVFKPLVERAAMAAAKAVKGSPDRELKESVTALLDKAIEDSECQGREWLLYNKGMILTELGDFAGARKLLVPIARNKRSEFWIWHALGKVEESENSELALALCSKSFLLCADPKFGVGVVEDIARLAAIQGAFDLAKWATNRAVSIRQNNGWKIPEVLRNSAKSDWYSTAQELKDANASLQRFSESADHVVYADLPRVRSNYLGSFKAKTGKRFLVFSILENGSAVEVVAEAKSFPDHDRLGIGASVVVGILRNEDKVSVFEVKEREDGEPFDCLEQRIGVIDHHNSGKALASIYFTAREFCLLPYSEYSFIESCSVGCSVKVYCVKSQDRIRPYKAEESDFRETESIRLVSGLAEMHAKGFAFIGDIFIPPPVAKSLSTDDVAQVIAVKKMNKKTGKIGWSAISQAKANTKDEWQ